MNLINELRELAEDLHSAGGHSRYAAALSKAADELAKWEAVFGHLGDTPDECGNAIIAARDELETRCDELSADKGIEVAAWLCGIPAQPAPSAPSGLHSLKTVRFWADAYTHPGDDNFRGHAMAAALLREYAELRAALAGEAKP